MQIDFKNIRSTSLGAIQFHVVHIVCHLPTASTFSEVYFGSLKISINFLAITTSEVYKTQSIFS